MKTRILSLAIALFGLFPSAADAQAPGAPPLITEAFADAETATLTFNGVGFREGFPVVYLGNNELPVRWAADGTAATWLPELRPGTYRLIARWPDGAQADFYLMLGAAGPAGPAGAPGPKGDRGLPGFSASAGASVDTSTGEGRIAAAPPGFGNLIYRGTANGVVTPTITGPRSTAFGFSVLSRITTGSNNTAFGSMALNGVTTGSANTAVGTVAMQYSGANSSRNTAVGYGALRNILGSRNIAVGYMAGAAYARSTSRAGTGSDNIFIGNQTNHPNTTGNNNIHIAHGSRSNPTGSDNIYIGHTGEPGDTGVVRLGGNAHTKTYLSGEVILHGSLTGNAGNPLNITGPVNAPALNTRIDALSTNIRADIDVRLKALDDRLTALEPATTNTNTPAP